ncbi:MAG: hypothetical protein J4N97_10265, partial [Chloroflexi bacterium]|nr:hypothetical protein [Chloroflexota bacterium]
MEWDRVMETVSAVLDADRGNADIANDTRAGPVMYASMSREYARSIRNQLKLLDERKRRGPKFTRKIPADSTHRPA